MLALLRTDSAWTSQVAAGSLLASLPPLLDVFVRYTLALSIEFASWTRFFDSEAKH
jgi:hypothetical protein